MNIKSTNHFYVDGKFVIEMKHYLEDFPFKYYIIVRVNLFIFTFIFRM